MNQTQFAEKLKAALSPSRAIRDPAHLKGRQIALRDCSQALTADGRQLFVHGFRGVGKSSVALTAAGAYSSFGKPSLIFCAETSNFYEIIRDMCADALQINPYEKETSSQTDIGGSAKIMGIGFDGKALETKKYAGVPKPNTLNEAVEILRRASPLIDGKGHVFVIDEFDLLKDEKSHQLFGSLAKYIADAQLPIKLIFCGVAENLDQLLKAHGSTFRYFHPLKLDTLKIQPCLDIIEDAEKIVGVEVEYNSKIRIVQICDGFPYFVHLITEKLLWQWFNDPDKNPKITTPKHYEGGLVDACSAAEPELRLPYDSVAKKYKLDGEIILWAMAEGDQLNKNLDMIERHFQKVFDLVPDMLKPKLMLNRNQLNSRLAAMKRAEYSEILQSNGRGWYEFSEKRMRGYARLRAAAQEVVLKSDHPRG